MDMNGDGLRRECAPGESFDSTIRDGRNQVSFDGNWRAQEMTGAAYDARFAEDDQRYARLLEALAVALAASSASRADAKDAAVLNRTRPIETRAVAR